MLGSWRTRTKPHRIGRLDLALDADDGQRMEFEDAKLPGIEGLRVHSFADCESEHCCIHNPSDHHMREWRLNWRADTGVMERLCPHGVGHPDPDSLAYMIELDPDNAWMSTHGCDGCCRPPIGE